MFIIGVDLSVELEYFYEIFIDEGCVYWSVNSVWENMEWVFLRVKVCK